MASDPWLGNLSNNSQISGFPYGFDDDFKPFIKMNDSGSYISTLENRLDRITGRSGKLTGRKIVEAVEKCKDDHMSDFLQGHLGSIGVNWNPNEEDSPVDTLPLQTFLKLKLHPEKCAMSAEELQCLLNADQLNLLNQATPAITLSNSSNNVEDSPPPPHPHPEDA